MNLDRWMMSTRMLRAAEDGTGAAAPAAAPAAAAESAAPAAAEAPSSPASPLATADSGKRDGAPAAKADSASPDAAKTTEKTPETSGEAPPPGGTEAKPAEPTEGDKKPEAGEADGKKPDAEKPADGKAETAEAAAEKKEGEGEAKPKEGEAPPKPTYEPYKLPENLKLDETRLGQFNDILGEAELTGKADHAVMQQIGQKLMDLYAGEAERIANDFRKYQVDVWNRHLETKVSELKADPEYGGNRIDTALGNAKYILEQFGGSKEEQSRLMATLDRAGVSSDRDFIALLNRQHERYREPQPVQPNLPSPKTNAGPGSRNWYDSVDVGKA